MVGGRKPKPAALRLVEGNREHREIPETVDAKIVRPRAPSWMDKIAKQEWKRIVEVLAGYGLLTDLDVKLLEAYCVCYGKWREAEEQASVTLVRMNDGKTIAANPFIKIAHAYLKEMRAIAVEFGMSPSSRNRVGTGAKTEDADPMEALLRHTS